MPGKDNTGPQGQGPMTGWGHGTCSGGMGRRAGGGQGRKGWCKPRGRNRSGQGACRRFQSGGTTGSRISSRQPEK